MNGLINFLHKHLCALICFTMVALSASNILAQDAKKTITGTVIDTEGEVVPGANVEVTSSSRMKWNVMTGIDGTFKFSIPEDVWNNQKLRMTTKFVGCKPTTTSISKQRFNYRVILNLNENELQEVVVTGYQVIDKRKAASAITSVKMEEVLAPSMTTIDQALEGRIPDLLFTQNSGEVGATARLRVRGTSTLSGNREPLWVLDGFVLQDPVDVSTDQLNDPDYINYIGNAISGINPQDIERIDVLKDAAATALYGSRASNGVIVVTTKKGQAGPPSVSYSNQTKLTTRPRYTDKNINLMNSKERVQFGKDLCELHYVFPNNMTMIGYEGAFYRYQSGQTTYDEFLSEVQKYETTNTDWFDILTKDAITQSHTLSVSGGSESTRYYSSLSYTNEEGVIRSEFVNRYTAMMNVMTDLGSNFQASIRLSGNVQKKNHLPSEVSPLDYAYNTTRALPAFNEDGSLYYYQNHGYNNSSYKGNFYKYNYNIFNEIENSASDYDGNTIIASADITYKLKNLLDLTASASYSRSATNQGVWFGENSNYVAILKNGEADERPLEGNTGLCELPYGGIYNTTASRSENFTGRIQANFRYAFGDTGHRHLFSSTAGYEVNMQRYNSEYDQTRGYFKERGMKYVNMDSETLNNFPLYKAWLANTNSNRKLTANKNNALSGYLTLSYDYNNYFSLGLSGRFDASNKFGSKSNQRFLPVWTAFGRWNVSNTLFKNVKWIDYMNMRLSYGKTGNMLDGQTPNLLLSQGTLDSFYGENISTVYSLPNPYLRWEKTTQVNLGLDFTLFSGRLTFSTDFWYKMTEEAFAWVNVSTINGVSSYSMNNGDIENKGCSFSISGYPIRTEDWRWYISTSYSWAANSVKTKTSENYVLGNYLNGTAIVDGMPIGTFYSYKYLGLNPNNGLPMFEDYEERQHLLEGKSLSDVVQMTMVPTGNRTPKLSGSVYTTLTYKQLSLTANFNYNIGSKMRKFAIFKPIMTGVSAEKNVRHEFVNRWQKPGDEKYTDIPALVSPSDENYLNYVNHWSTGAGASIANIKTFATSLWDMYDNSDLRVVKGDYLRLSNLTASYRLPYKVLQNTLIKSLRFDLSVSNVFTLCSSKLDGQDPTQNNFNAINLSIRPAYTFGLNITF